MKYYVIACRDYDKKEYVLCTDNYGMSKVTFFQNKKEAEESLSNFENWVYRPGRYRSNKIEVIEIDVPLRLDAKDVEVTMDEVYEKFGCKVVIKQDAKDCPACSD